MVDQLLRVNGPRATAAWSGWPMNWPAFGVVRFTALMCSVMKQMARSTACGLSPSSTPSTKIFGRLHVPLPSSALWRLLRSQTPLHGHLPSPGVLLVLLCSPLDTSSTPCNGSLALFSPAGYGVNGILFAVYQWLALLLLPHLSGVITTSPLLAKELQHGGCASHQDYVFPVASVLNKSKCGLALQQQQQGDGAEPVEGAVHRPA